MIREEAVYVLNYKLSSNYLAP